MFFLKTNFGIYQYDVIDGAEHTDSEPRITEIDDSIENENDTQEAATDPDFLVNMKLRERYRKNRRDEIRRNQYIKAQERLRKKVFTSDISAFLNRRRPKIVYQ